MRKTVRRIVAWGVGIGLAAVFGVSGAAGAVDGPNAFFLPAQGVAGQELSLIGTGFDPFVTVQLATSPDEEPVAVGHTNSEGGFLVPFTIPDEQPGKYGVILWVGGIEWIAWYTVVASDPGTTPPPGDSDGAVWFEPPAGTVGQNLQLIGLGFPTDSDVLVTTSASPDPTLVGKSAGDGTFTLPFAVPDLSPGQHPVQVRVGDQTATLNLFVLPSDDSSPGNDGAHVDLTPDAAAVGEQITVLAGGFGPVPGTLRSGEGGPERERLPGNDGLDGRPVHVVAGSRHPARYVSGVRLHARGVGQYETHGAEGRRRLAVPVADRLGRAGRDHAHADTHVHSDGCASARRERHPRRRHPRAVGGGGPGGGRGARRSSAPIPREGVTRVLSRAPQTPRAPSDSRHAALPRAKSVKIRVIPRFG
ncbi:hypothetical protein RKD05_001378 [Microbacterium sp. SLBN-111]